MNVSGSRQAGGTIPWRKRADLILRRDETGSWIVKDPLSLQYMMLTDQELCVLRMLDGQCGVQQIQDRLNLAWPQLAIDTSEIVDLLNQLIARCLVLPQHAAAISESGNQNLSQSHRRVQQHAAVLSAAMKLFRIQIHLFDPTPLLQWLNPIIQRLFSRQTAFIAAILIGTAGLLVLLRFQQLTEQLADWHNFFGPENMVLLLISFVGIKALHELGHACAAHRYRIECRDAGVMLLFFTPLLYTNVTDAWMADRRSRLIVTAAGVMVELVIASLCAILWFCANPGFTQNLLLNNMILCTASTLLFNGNPLLRYDGYFLLADATLRPNLAAQAASCVRSMLEHLLWGNDSRQSKPGDYFLLCYGILSAVYRIVLTVGILAMLVRMADSWNIGAAGLLLAAMAAVMLIVIPTAGLFRDLLTGLMSRSDRKYRAARGGLLTILLAAALAVPLPCSILVPAVVEPSGHPVYATFGGQLRQHLTYGDQVSAGDVIAVLKDHDLLRELVKLKGEVAQQELRVQALELQRHREDAAQLPVAREILAAAAARLNQFETRIDSLRITASTAGVLLPPRETEVEEDEFTLAAWTRKPLNPFNERAWIEAGTILGYVTTPQQVHAVAYLTESQLHRLQRDQQVRLQSMQFPGRVLTGEIQQISTMADGEVPAELPAAGLLKTHQVPSGKTTERYWQVLIRISCEEVDCPALYSAGIVRIPVAPLSIPGRVMQYLRSAFLDEQH